MRGLELVKIFNDEGISGGKALGSRPDGSKLLSALRKQKVNIVVVLKLDRGFRNAADCLQTVETWDRQAISLHILDLGGNAVDTTTAAGKFMLTVLAGAAEMERNLTRERTKAAMGVKRNRLERISRYAPFGWDLRPDGKLVKNPRGQRAICFMQELRASGKSYRGIAAILDSEGIPPKRGSKWIHTAVKSILKRAA